MLALDSFNKNICSLSTAKNFLNSNDYKVFSEMDDISRENHLSLILENPITDWTLITETYFRWKWSTLFNKLYANKKINLLEIASGDADIIPQTLSVTNSDSYYITANMNKSLNNSLLEKTKGLNINLKLIDDDASKIRFYLEDNSIDIIAFQHGVNDVLQAMLCSKENIDTVNVEWMDCLPKMIELVQKEVANNSFEKNLKEPFINFINELSYTLKENGIIAINHYMFQLDLDLGYPKEIFEDLIPIVRNWLKFNDSVEEIFFEDFNSQWWLFLKKKPL
ncbi:MAG: hypothetical protein ACRDD2_09805 [Sarcina sp.]